MFTLSSHRVGVLMFDAAAANLYLRIYNSAGTQTANVDITSRINWNHTTHGGVDFNAIQLNNGNIFITHVASTNSTGIQTYNARYTILTETGAAVSSGQLNSVNQSSSYIFSILLDKLSDGKIVTVFRKTSGADNLAFRLFNADGTVAGSDYNFSGPGTANSFVNTYGFMLAAGKNGNFIVTAYFWNGAMRGFIFTNAGVNALPGGATHIMIDATAVNNYGNTGVVALPNGNFAASWWLSYHSYIKTISPTGVTILDKTMIPDGGYQEMIPYNTPGSEGFVLTDYRQQDAGDMGNPYSGLWIHRYNQDGVWQSSAQSAEGWMIQPTFTVLPGVGGGYATSATYYKTFVVEEDMPGMGGMAMPTGDNDISGRMVNFSMTPLPVRLVGYNATLLNNNTVLLTWTTGSEENNGHFEIERSTDGRNYTVIGSVDGRGTTDAVTEYRFTDALVLSQTTYYRLKQFDIDGRMEDLGVKFIRKESAKTSVSVYPNPSQGKNITLSAGTVALPSPYRIFDLQGRVVVSGMIRQARQDVNAEKLASGTYLVQVGNEVIKIQRK